VGAIYPTASRNTKHESEMPSYSFLFDTLAEFANQVVCREFMYRDEAVGKNYNPCVIVTANQLDGFCVALLRALSGEIVGWDAQITIVNSNLIVIVINASMVFDRFRQV
jgi:hypothetical protein